MLFEQLRAVALATGVLLAVACGGWAMTGTPGGDTPTIAPAARSATDPAARLVAQLGAEDFADREAAERELRKLGPKAEPALKAARTSDSPEVRDRAAKLLTAIRRDALDALAKGFDPAKEAQPAHPVWTRFKAIAGDTRASRELFARIIQNEEWRHRLDAAEFGPEDAARQYRDACAAVGKHFRSNLTVWFEIPVWPCDRGEEVAYLLLLGSYPGTESACPKGQPEAQQFSDGEGRIHFARGLELGLQGKMLDLLGGKFRPDAVAVMAGTDRVFAKLLGAWLARRDDTTAVYRGFELAVKYSAAGSTSAARAVAAGKDRGGEARCAALAAVAQFGTPADLPLFPPLFDDATEMIIAPPPTGKSPGPRSRRPKVHDRAIGLALLLCDRDPAEFGFPYAKDRFRRENGRPVVADYEAEAFGSPDDKAREAAHAKARAFITERLKQEKPKKADPPARGAKVWPRFAEVVGDDADSRALFDRIVSNPKNVELLEKATDGDSDLLKLYRTRRDELHKSMGEQYEDWLKKQAQRVRPPIAAGRRVPSVKIPSRPGIPVADTAGWLLLGTYPATTVNDSNGPRPEFLSEHLFAEALDKGPVAKPLRKLVAAWLANRGDEPRANTAGQGLALMFDIPDALPAARRLIKNDSAVKDPREKAVAHACGILVVAKYGMKTDLPLIAEFADNSAEVSTVLLDKPGQKRVGTEEPVDGQDITTQVRDLAIATMIHLHGGEPRDFGFFWHGDLYKLSFPNSLTFHEIGFKSKQARQAAHAKAKDWMGRQDPAAGLLPDLADLDGMRRGEQTDFVAVEKRGEELLAKYPAAADRGRIYTTLTRVYSNSGIGRTFARVTKYGRLALDHEKDPVSRGQVFSYLASAAEVAVPADPLSDDPFPVKRRRAAGILLEGHRELLPLKLPATAPELPRVEKIGGLLDGADPAEEARIRERHAAQIKARREAEFTREMIHRRDISAMQLKSLYGREPKSDDELRKLVGEALEDPGAAADLLDRVGRSR